MLALLALSDNVYSFEIDGFRSGMEINGIAEILKRRSYIRVMEAQTGKEVTDDIRLNAHNSGLVVYDVSNPNNWNMLYGLSFCKHRLVQLQKEFEPSFKNFTLMSEKLSLTYGKATNYDIRTGIGETSGDSYSFSLMWIIGAENKKLTYTYHEKIKGYPYDQLYMVYTVINECF